MKRALAELKLFGPLTLVAEQDTLTHLVTLTLRGENEGELVLAGEKLEVQEQLIEIARKCLQAERLVKERGR